MSVTGRERGKAGTQTNNWLHRDVDRNHNGIISSILQGFGSGGGAGCDIYFDSVLCWPRTPVATWAVLPCPDTFHGLLYDSSGINGGRTTYRRRVNYSIAIEPNSITHTCTLILRLPMSTENATRYCHLNGNWDNYTNYETCHHIGEAGPGFDAAVELPTYIYCLGYLISLLSLALAVFVFIRFK